MIRDSFCSIDLLCCTLSSNRNVWNVFVTQISSTINIYSKLLHVYIVHVVQDRGCAEMCAWTSEIVFTALDHCSFSTQDVSFDIVWHINCFLPTQLYLWQLTDMNTSQIDFAVCHTHTYIHRYFCNSVEY